MDDRTTKSVSVVVVPHHEGSEIRVQSASSSIFDDAIALILDEITPENVVKTLLLRKTDSSGPVYAHHQPESTVPNIRATRFAMACGMFPVRFYGDVVISRSSAASLSLAEVEIACSCTADLRRSIVSTLSPVTPTPPLLTEWLTNAAKANYHDGAALARLADVMTRPEAVDEEPESEDDLEDDNNEEDDNDEENDNNSEIAPSREFITNVPLCLNCRKQASTLCPNCCGVYFCDPPSTCRQDGWSHQCLCKTWKLYTERREKLSTFQLAEWSTALVQPEFQTSEIPYEEFLAKIGIRKGDLESFPWWKTEVGGWSGGEGVGAKLVNLERLLSYEEGFTPIVDIPPERSIGTADLTRLRNVRRNSIGLLKLTSWEDYYTIRDIPITSPVALLLTFPLTLYHAIVECGEVPVTVAQMLKRPLRVHVVGAEKELSFLPLFKEVTYLLPEISIEIVFVVRDDMLPPGLSSLSKFAAKLAENLKIVVVSGTYGDTVDPNFDCGSGQPDMVVAFNAGLFAYESWRSVIVFLDRNPGVIGYFTDYNEFSGAQCASLGGAKSRESLSMNPFRQPRAMPVYSMNLPQFSNGFCYVFNPQKLE